MNAHSRILDAGKTPADWVMLLAERGIDISERTLREKANRLGACHKLGRAMLITPEQMDTILESGQPCPSKSMQEARPGGRAGGSNSTVNPSPTTTDAALEHLRKLAQGNGASKKKKSGSVITFSGTPRQSDR